MSKVRINIWIEEEQREGLLEIKERDGVNESEQIRRGIDLWLQLRLADVGIQRHGLARTVRK